MQSCSPPYPFIVADSSMIAPDPRGLPGQLPVSLGYPPPQYPPGMVHPYFMPPYAPAAGSGGMMSYLPSVANEGAIPPAAMTTASVQTPPLHQNSTPIPVPGHPGLFYFPPPHGHGYPNSQPMANHFSVPPTISVTPSRQMDFPVLRAEAATANAPDEPVYCFQCQKWHATREAQEQAHAASHAEAGTTTEPASLNHGSVSVNEDALAARMNQAIKDAVAGEFALRQNTSTSKYIKHARGSRHPSSSQNDRRVSDSGRHKRRDWENSHDDHSRPSTQYRDTGSRGTKYMGPESRCTTPSDARAWRDAFSDLDPDEVRAETDTMVSANYSDMTIQDYHHDRRNSRNRRRPSNDSSSVAGNSEEEEDTGLPLKYLPSKYPTTSNYSAQYSRDSQSQRKEERQKYSAPPSTKHTKSHEVKSAERQIPKTRRHESKKEWAKDTSNKGAPGRQEPEKHHPTAEKPAKRQSNSASLVTQVAAPTPTEAEHAVLAYARWYAETYGVDPAFITKLQSAMSTNSPAPSTRANDGHGKQGKPTDFRPVAETEHFSVQQSEKSAKISSPKSGNTAKQKKKRVSPKKADMKGGNTGTISPALHLESLSQTQRAVASKGQPVPLQTKNGLSYQTISRSTGRKPATNTQQPNEVTPPATFIKPVTVGADPSPLILEQRNRYKEWVAAVNGGCRPQPVETERSEQKASSSSEPVANRVSKAIAETIVDDYTRRTEKVWDHMNGGYVDKQYYEDGDDNTDDVDGDDEGWTDEDGDEDNERAAEAAQGTKELEQHSSQPFASHPIPMATAETNVDVDNKPTRKVRRQRWDYEIRAYIKPEDEDPDDPYEYPSSHYSEESYYECKEGQSTYVEDWVNRCDRTDVRTMSGVFSDVETEVTMFPTAGGERVVGRPRVVRTGYVSEGTTAF